MFKLISGLLIVLVVTGCGGGDSSTKVDEPNDINYTLTIPNAMYSTATSPVVVDINKIDPNIDYCTGANINSKLYSMSDIIDDKSDTLIFDVDVPNETKYGTVKGKTLEYSAYLLYPTTEENSDAAELVCGKYLPKMQKSAELPKFPNDTKKFPLIIFSHGMGDHPVTYVEFLQELVSRGYMVLSIWHGDEQFSERSSEVVALRPLSMKKAIDYILQQQEYATHIDTTKIAAIGSSLGGLSVAGLTGAKVMDFSSPVGALMEVEHDTRIKAAVGIVPYFGGPDTYGHSTTDSKTIFTPYMAFGGDADSVSSFGLIEDNLKNISSDTYLIKFHDLGHPLSADAYSDITAWTINYLQAYLDNNTDSKTTIQNVTSYSGYEDDEKISLSTKSF